MNNCKNKAGIMVDFTVQPLFAIPNYVNILKTDLHEKWKLPKGKNTSILETKRKERISLVKCRGCFIYFNLLK